MVPQKRSHLGGGVMKFKTTAVGAFLLLHTWGSYGLTLGALQGNAWLGRRLDVSAVAQLSAGQATATLCATAEVFHAELPPLLPRPQPSSPSQAAAEVLPAVSSPLLPSIQPCLPSQAAAEVLWQRSYLPYHRPC